MRKYTELVLDAVEQGFLEDRAVTLAALNHIDDNEVLSMIESNFPCLLEEEEEEESDKALSALDICKEAIASGRLDAKELLDIMFSNKESVTYLEDIIDMHFPYLLD